MRTIKVGFVGSGGFARKHMGYVSQMEDVRIEAVCGSAPGRADALAEEFSVHSHCRIVEMLDNHELDALFICTPPHAHGEYELEAAARGIPFFVEKPLGVDRETVERIGAAVEERGLITSAGYHWRYMEAVRRAVQELEGSRIGLLHGYWHGTVPRVPWWISAATSGGQLHEQTTHLVDLARYLCGEIEEVYAAYNLLEMNRIEGLDVPDVGSVTVKFRSGAVGTFTNTCLLDQEPGGGLDLFTTGPLLKILRHSLHVKRQGEEHTYCPGDDPHLEGIEAFIHAVRSGDPSGIRSSYRDAMETFRVTMACNESAATGRPVRL